jgi:GDP-4-dehydro-6-deoxy-D-mannose reductase
VRFLITGACGFVGPYLSRRLAAEDAEILGLGLSADACIEGRYLYCDILDFKLLQQIMQDFCPDRVFHLAGLVYPAESRERARDYYLVNVQGAVNLLETMRLACPQARLLLVSSAEVYGASHGPSAITEGTPPRPLNHYGMSKLLAEQVAMEYKRQFGIWTVIVRAFNHSGPGQSERFVISDFCRQIAEAESRMARQPGGLTKIQVGNLGAERDFLDVRDVVDAYAKLMEQGVDGEIYNVCAGEGTAIQKILDTAIRHARVEVKVEVSQEKFRPLQFPRLVGDNAKLRATIDWRPRHPLDETITDTLGYWRNQLASADRPNSISQDGRKS